MLGSPAHAGEAVATSRPELDPDNVAHVVVREEPEDLVTPRKYALGGRFVGDLNGDGRDDIALPAGIDDRIELFFGTPLWGRSGQDHPNPGGESSLHLPVGCRDDAGRIKVTSAGDLDGDGRADLAVACPNLIATTVAGTATGALALFWGRADWPANVSGPDRLVVGRAALVTGGVPSEGDLLGNSVAGLGDIDGDGYDEVAISGGRYEALTAPPTWIFRGGPDVRSELRDTSDAEWILRPGPGQDCLSVMEVAPLGDIDGDGFADIATSCLLQPMPPSAANSLDVQWSAFLGADLGLFPPGEFDLANRSFGISASLAAPARAIPGALLSDLDGDGFDDFAMVRYAESSGLLSARTILGHAGPWDDIDLYIPGQGDPLAAIDPFPWWSAPGTFTSADALDVTAAPDVDADGRMDLWVRSGVGADSGVALLTEIDPSRWADFESPPWAVRFSTPGDASISTAARVALGGRGDANGDGVPDLLITSGWTDGEGCTAAVCGGAWLILCVDADADGRSVCAGDCDDRDASRAPHLAEACDELDHDCDGRAGTLDADGDGARGCDGDCDDDDPAVRPFAPETCDDSRDLDCDGGAPEDDLDGDGARHCDDCQPWMPTLAPGLAEQCDGLDGNCDEMILRDEQDADRDGLPRCPASQPGDCDDRSATVGPHRAEDCTDGRDDDCDTRIDENEDEDGDGVRSCEGDCDDAIASVFPGAEELCDGRDNDCDTRIDDTADTDGDGANRCLDCDDLDPQQFPGNVGRCDGRDLDCIAGADVADLDGDGWSACAGDCDDTRQDRRPAFAERCDRLDNDCDTLIDEDFDADLDGFATCHGDCNDGAAPTFPQSLEPACDDDVDGDCDGDLDADDADCPILWTPTPEPARPYGIGCLTEAPAAAAVLPVFLLIRRASRRHARGARPEGRKARQLWTGCAILLGAALSSPGHVLAARAEKGVVVYLSDHPDVGAMGKAKALARVLSAEEVVHAGELLGPPPPHPMALGAGEIEACAGERGMDLQMASGQALDRLIELDHSNAETLLDQAIRTLPCHDRPVSPRQLAELHYHRAVARVALRKYPLADEDFRATLVFAPDFPGDPNFPPEVNGRLADLRSEVRERAPVRVFVYSPPGGRVSIDGRDLDPRDGVEVLPGRHLVQFVRGKVVHGIRLEVREGDKPLLVLPPDRIRGLRDAAADATARRLAARILTQAADRAELDLVAVVDLDAGSGQLIYTFRPSSGEFTFDGTVPAKGGAVAANTGTARGGSSTSKQDSGSKSAANTGSARRTDGRTEVKQSSSGTGASGTPASSTPSSRERAGGSTSAGAAGPRASSGNTAAASPVRKSGGTLSDAAKRNLERSPVASVRLLGAWSFAAPWHYAALDLDLSVRLVSGLRLDAGAIVATPGKGEWGWITLPVVQAGVSWQFQTPVIEPRVGAVAQVAIDRSGGPFAARLGFAIRGGVDVPIPETPLIGAVDVQGGMLGVGTGFVHVGGGIGVRF